MLLLEPLEPRWMLSTVQDFDTTPGTPLTFGQCGAAAPGPVITPGGPSGKFLRLATNTVGNSNSVAFPVTDPGPYTRIVVEFDFRMTPPPGSIPADGVGFALLNTTPYGQNGAICPEAPRYLPEEPNFQGSLGVGFDTYQNLAVGDTNNNHVSIHFNGALVDQMDAQAIGSLDQGRNLHAQVVLRPGQIAGGGDVTVRLKTVGQPDSAYVTLFDHRSVPGFSPYEGRVWFGARSGGLTADHDIDNIHVRFGSTSLGVFDPGAAVFYLRNSLSAGIPDAGSFQYGGANWKPVAGDWDRDGRDTVGVFAPDGRWYLRNSNTSGPPDAAPFPYGLGAWTPVTGDWNGDGFDTIGVFDPSKGEWHLRDQSSSGDPSIPRFVYGLPGWLPVVGDWDANGTDTIGVVDPGSGTCYLRNTNSAGTPDFAPFQCGTPGSSPVAGDWDGNRSGRIGAFDPTAARFTLRNDLTAGPSAYGTIQYGARGWRPVMGDWDASGPKLSPLLAAQPPHASVEVPSLTEAELRPVVVSALARLETANLSSVDLAALGVVQFLIADLPGNMLGLADAEGRTIYLDGNASGHGWFVDPTPLEDEEFAPNAVDDYAATRMDLLTVVLHELGHLAGLDDLDPLAHFGDLMGATLDVGTRRVVTDMLFAQPDRGNGLWRSVAYSD